MCNNFMIYEYCGFSVDSPMSSTEEMLVESVKMYYFRTFNISFIRVCSAKICQRIALGAHSLGKRKEE